MRLAYHPLVQSDVSEILRHYDRISPRLGDEFWTELMRLVALVAAKPERFHFEDTGHHWPGVAALIVPPFHRKKRGHP